MTDAEKTLDPLTKPLLDMIEALNLPPLAEIDAQTFRLQRERGRDILNRSAPDLAIVRDARVAGGAGAGSGDLAARIYDAVDADNRPTLVYFHGGGFVYGDLDSHDALCRRLADHGRIRVVAVDYRLAPEHPFPAAVDDAIAALAHIATDAAAFGADPDRLAVGGDSAGACLAAVAARNAARNGGPALSGQLLIYPVTIAGRPTPSRETYAEGYFLTKESMDWFEGHYLPPGTDLSDERVSPLLHEPPSGLAPAYVVTAGFDPLLDEGKAYAALLEKAGVETAYDEYPNQIHGFVSFTAFSTVAEEAIEKMAKATARFLGA